MNLDGLIAAGGFVIAGTVKKNVTWKQRNTEGKMVTHNFDIHVKKELSAADFEFIFFGKKSDDVMMAKRVHRLVRLGDHGDEAVPYDAAAAMVPGLLMALCAAINEVEKENQDDDDETEGGDDQDGEPAKN